jgi:hypothetical protein
MLYMTTHLPALTRTLLLWSKEPEFRNRSVPVFDLLLNPDRSEEMRQELDQVDRLTVQLFEKMDFSQVKQQEIILSVLWFSAQPCKRLLTYCNW